MSRLGARAIADICVTMMVKEKVFSANGHHGHLIRELWQHASISGVYGQKIGQLMRGDHELALLCGLLHDIGKPILVRQVEELERTLDERFPIDIVKGVLEPLHEEVGGIAIREWELPAELAAAASSHHDHSGELEHPRAAGIASLADTLATWAIDAGAREDQRLRDLPVVAALGLTPFDLGGLFTARERIAEIAEVYA